jgi:hypothetical protein
VAGVGAAAEAAVAFGEFDERLRVYAGSLERTLGVPPA